MRHLLEEAAERFVLSESNPKRKLEHKRRQNAIKHHTTTADIHIEDREEAPEHAKGEREAATRAADANRQAVSDIKKHGIDSPQARKSRVKAKDLSDEHRIKQEDRWDREQQDEWNEHYH
jgi:hypothetical protein